MRCLLGSGSPMVPPATQGDGRNMLRPYRRPACGGYRWRRGVVLELADGLGDGYFDG